MKTKEEIRDYYENLRLAVQEHEIEFRRQIETDAKERFGKGVPIKKIEGHRVWFVAPEEFGYRPVPFEYKKACSMYFFHYVDWNRGLEWLITDSVEFWTAVEEHCRMEDAREDAEKEKDERRRS